MKRAKGWPRVTLGEVVEFPGAGVPVADCTMLHPVLTFKGLQRTGELRFDDPRTGQEVCKNLMTLLRAGDTVATNQGHAIGWILKKVGYIPPLDPFPVAASTLQVFRPRSDSLAPKYLFHYLAWTDTYRRVADMAGSRSSFTAKMFAAVPILLPPLAEQKRIAGILDAADALRAKRREALAQLDTLIESTFLDMFGDPVTNPMEWDTFDLEQVGQVITGNTPSRKRPDYYGDDIEWIKSDNINDPSVFLTEAEERLSVAGKAVARTSPKGSILVTCIAGSPACIGNAAIADREVAFNQQINAFVPGERIGSWFALGMFLVGKRLVQSASTNAMKGMVSKSAFSAVSVPLPPMSLQNRFAAIFESINQQMASQRAHLTELDTLFASLQSRAFRGDL